MMQQRRTFFTGIAGVALLLCGLLPLHARDAAPVAGKPAQVAAVPKVALQTSMGKIVLELHPDKAPKSVANFLRYVEAGRYQDTIFHRVIEGFMIQGGGFNQAMVQQPGFAPIANEAANGLKNKRYTVAMARTADPHSASSQFFINTSDNASLDHPSPDGWGYAVFGTVVEGQKVVDRIEQTPTARQGAFQDVPVKPVIIQSARLLP